jgi:hypothetical protein
MQNVARRLILLQRCLPGPPAPRPGKRYKARSAPALPCNSMRLRYCRTATKTLNPPNPRSTTAVRRLRKRYTHRRPEYLVTVAHAIQALFDALATYVTRPFAGPCLVDQPLLSQPLAIIKSVETVGCFVTVAASYLESEGEPVPRPAPLGARGVANARSKITPEKAAAIRADPRPSKLVAAEYGIDESNVRKIRRGETWQAAPSSQIESSPALVPNLTDRKSLNLPRSLERETRLELATPTLARSCSTN